MQPTIKAVLRKDRSKDGKFAIVIKVSYAGQRKQILTGLFVEEKYFKDGKVEKIPNATQYNQIITNKKNELERSYLTQQIEVGSVSLKESKSISRKDFYEYAVAHYKGMRNRCKKDYIDRCISVIEDFHSWAGQKSFQRITDSLLKEYEDHLFERGLSRNTVNRMFKRLKQVFIAAKVPWYYKPVTYKQTKRDFLSREEIDLIEEHGRDHIVKWAFLVSCYTGLRYSDLCQPLKVTKNKGVKRLIIETVKTKDIVSIKINDRVEGYIKKMKGKLPSNNNTNLIMKDLAADAGIKRRLIFHMGRHSFAVNGLSLGIPIKAISQLLGHRTIKTTEIYAKYTDTDLDGYMDKWG